MDYNKNDFFSFTETLTASSLRKISFFFLFKWFSFHSFVRSFGGGSIGEFTCTDPASPKFFSPQAAALLSAAAATAASADVTVLCLGLGDHMEGEGADRVNMTLPSVRLVLALRMHWLVLRGQSEHVSELGRIKVYYPNLQTSSKVVFFCQRISVEGLKADVNPLH